LSALRVHACALWLAVLGCEPEPSAATGADGGAFPMELGHGELAFMPLVEGEALPYAAGTQSGHHVFVAFRMHDLDPMRVLVRVTTAVEGHAELVLERRGRVTFEPAASAAARAPSESDASAAPAAGYVYAGWPAQILAAPDHIGERTRIDVLLEDKSGRRASASETIVIGGPK
jgi:hypothetical protein